MTKAFRRMFVATWAAVSLGWVAPLEAAPPGVADLGRPAQTKGCLPRPAGLVGWWRGENDATDSVGTNNASPSGGVTFAPGKVGHAFRFLGNEFETAPVKRSGAMTIDFWAMVGSPGQEAWVSPISTGLPGHFDPFFQILLDGHDHWKFDVGNPPSEITPLLGDATPLIFQHIAVTYDGARSLLFYINGSQVAAATWTGTQPLGYEVLKLGANRDQNRLFVGLIDEVHLFARALSAAEVTSIYRADSAGLCLKE